MLRSYLGGRTRCFIGALALTLLVGLSIWAAINRNVALAQTPQAASGQEIFRFDTFGDEQFWTDKLRMHIVIERSIDPLTALSLGLKVDVDALPAELQQAILDGDVDLTEPCDNSGLNWSQRGNRRGGKGRTTRRA
jgi:hypothetical protein